MHWVRRFSQVSAVFSFIPCRLPYLCAGETCSQFAKEEILINIHQMANFCKGKEQQDMRDLAVERFTS